MWDAYYERQGKLAVFKARRTLVLPIREPPEAASGDLPITVEDYLANPERLVRIVYGPGQVRARRSPRGTMRVDASALCTVGVFDSGGTRMKSANLPMNPVHQWTMNREIFVPTSISRIQSTNGFSIGQLGHLRIVL